MPFLFHVTPLCPNDTTRCRGIKDVLKNVLSSRSTSSCPFYSPESRRGKDRNMLIFVENRK
jgi:hypothetical protein